MKIHYMSSGLTLSGLGAMAMALMLPFAACNSTSEQSAVTAKVSDTPTLSPSQIAKIKVIHKTFSEVDNSTLDEMITNFKKDRNPDSEIAVWEDMGNAYTKFIAKSTAKPDLAKKQEAFKLILLRSSMTAAEANQELNPQVLSPKEIEDILSYYVAAPQPVTAAK